MSPSPSPVIGEGDDLSRPGDVGHIRRPMSESTGPCRVVADRQPDVGARPSHGWSPRGSRTAFGPSGVRYFAGSVGIDGFDEQILRPRSPRVVRPQAIESFWPSTKTGAPGMVAPLTDPSGVTMRARYQRIGALELEMRIVGEDRLAVSVREPAITHSFDAPWPIPVSAPSSSSTLSSPRVLVADRRAGW